MIFSSYDTTARYIIIDDAKESFAKKKLLHRQKIKIDTVVIRNLSIINDVSPDAKYRAITGLISVSPWYFITVRVKYESSELRIKRDRSAINS